MNDKPYRNILIYEISYKPFNGVRLLHIIFNKVSVCIISYVRALYSLLFGFEKYDTIFDRIRNFLLLKSGITFFFPYNFGTIKIDSDNGFALEDYSLSHLLIKLKITATKFLQLAKK